MPIAERKYAKCIFDDPGMYLPRRGKDPVEVMHEVIQEKERGNFLAVLSARVNQLTGDHDDNGK